MQLSVEGVGLSYAGRSVLKDVSFELHSQESALLLGPSGSGKSSLLNVICGLRTPDSGTVTLGEGHLASSTGSKGSDEVRRRSMGIIFQTLRLVSALNLQSNLLLAQKLQMGTHDRGLIDSTLERLEIAHLAHSRPHQLSQGEAQRAAIARALVVKPALIIADEPTSALDAANTQRVATLLIEASQEAGASLLIATHDDRLMPYFKRSLQLENGQVTG